MKETGPVLGGTADEHKKIGGLKGNLTWEDQS
jgi:hypothetical protein